MKPPQSVDLQTVVQTFEAIPELAAAGVLAGANALYLEHLQNDLGRYSLDIDLQNQTDDLETIHRRFSAPTKKRLRLVSRLSAEFYEYETRVWKSRGPICAIAENTSPANMSRDSRSSASPT